MLGQVKPIGQFSQTLWLLVGPYWPLGHGSSFTVPLVQKWPLGQAFPSIPSVGRGVVEPLVKEKIRQENNLMKKLPVHLNRLAEKIYVGTTFLP